MKKAVKILIIIIVLVALVVFIAGVVFLTDGFSTSIKTFYLKIENNYILEYANGYILNKNKGMSVDVVNLEGKISGKNSAYFVEIVPADDVDFDFTVDGIIHSFADVPDLSAGFKIESNDKGFTVTPKGGMRDILSAVYQGQEVEVERSIHEAKDEFFKLIVLSEDKSKSVYVTFGVDYYVSVTGVEFDDAGIEL